MAITVTFSTAGSFTIEDDGIPGNNTSIVRRDSDGAILAVIPHPADSLTFRATVPGVNLTFNVTDSFGSGVLTVGSLTNSAETPDSIVVRNILSSSSVTLVSNSSITEGGSDFAADIVASSIILSALSGVGTPGNAIETQTGLLEAETTTGGITISNFGAVTIGGLSDQVNGLDVASSGDLILSNFGTILLGDVDLDPGNPPPLPLETVHGGNTSGNVSLIANGLDADIVATTDNDAITAPRGNITLTAGRDIAFGTIGTNFDNDVRASGSIVVNAGRDFLIDGFADMESDNFGQGTGGNVVVNTGRNVHLRNVAGTDGGIAATGGAGADIIITTGFNGALILDAPSASALSSASGDIIVNADRVLISASSGINAGAGQVILRPATDGREIILGSAGDAAFAVELSDAELDRIFTSSLTIGSDSGGQVTVSALVDPANAPNLTLRSGTDIFIQASMNLTASLTLRAGDNIFQTPSTINVPTFAAFADQAGDDGNAGGIINLGGIVSGTTSTLTGNAEADTLTGTSANETIFGLGGNDTLRGNGGNDTLDGGTGVDTMLGGLGDDFYFVDNGGDIVTEATSEGNDRIFTSVSYALAGGSSVETINTANNGGTAPLNLTGNALGQFILGNAGANVLSGGGGADTLAGLGGDDVLVGNADAPSTLQGGTGNDTYRIANAGDSVIELAGEGNDRILASVSYVLGAGREVEQLFTADQAGVAPLNLTGNALGQAILGNAGANVLTGGGGADTLLGLGGDDTLFGNADAASTMQGGTGDDRYFISRTGDTVVELAGEGSDRILSSVSYVLGPNREIEIISTQNQAGTDALNLTGNEFGQTLLGNNGANTLSGAGGADVLAGFAGADILLGGAGDDQLNGGAANDILNGGADADRFIFADALGAGNVDLVQDFVTGLDRIFLENAVFTGLAGGALPVGAFRTGAAAGDADDRIIYNPANGALFFDADGNGAGAAVQFATLSGAPALAASDFVVI
ncbi:MAG: hypothetical protein ACT4N8_14205 [Sphingosinicella sp.]|uniref:hypothetical protein n=1 Tax=Sphingosinicella sp. TaxID=1917971 RepID=UPI0040383B6F